MTLRFWLLDVRGRWDGARLDGVVVDAAGALVLEPASSPSDGARVRSGTFVAAATAPDSVSWGAVTVEGSGLGRLRLFTCVTGPADEAPPLPPLGDVPDVGAPTTAAGQWRTVPAGVATAYALHPPAARLWVAGRLEGVGADSPVIRQVRVEEADATWAGLLPAVYRRDEDALTTLTRLLALLRVPVAALDRRLADVPLLLDPRTAPDDGGSPTPLEELAGWVGVELAEGWDTARRRAAVAGAVAAARSRGTPAGIAAAVTAATGVPVTVEEPGEWSAVWSLGAERLGLSTMLPAADPEPAVLGTTATLGAAVLGEAADYGAPALGPLAGRVTVLARESDLGASGAAPLAAVLEEERPAYARAHLCVVGPRLRPGMQARLGIDAIVAGPPPPLRLGTSRLGGDSGLGTGGAS